MCFWGVWTVDRFAAGLPRLRGLRSAKIPKRLVLKIPFYFFFVRSYVCLSNVDDGFSFLLYGDVFELVVRRMLALFLIVYFFV